MNETDPGERKLTQLDFTRLSLLRGDIPAELTTLLKKARIVGSSEIPSGIVTMYAQAEIEDMAAGRRLKVVLCYPEHAEPRAGYVSVLSPIGIALLGQELGSLACWQSSDGEKRSAEIVSVSVPLPVGDGRNRCAVRDA